MVMGMLRRQSPRQVNFPVGDAQIGLWGHLIRWFACRPCHPGFRAPVSSQKRAPAVSLSLRLPLKVLLTVLAGKIPQPDS